MLTRSQIQWEERQSNEHHRLIHATFERRSESKAAFEAWKNACREWHGSEVLCCYLWGRDARDRMRQGEREVIEDALLFLEVDPWFFRSGYLKERVLHHLKTAPINDTDRKRLRHVIKMVTQGRNRRELRDYCRLSLQVWTPEWEEQLRAEASSAAANKGSIFGGGKLKYLLSFWDCHRDKLLLQ